MMKRTIRLLLVLTPFWLASCESSMPNVGLGLIHIENDFTTLLEFYNKPDDSLEPAFFANLIYEKDSVMIKTSLKKEDVLKFNPLYLGSSRSIVVLQVLEEREGWLRVLTDDNNDVKHWLKSNNFNVESWFDFLKSVKQVKPHRSDQNPLRKAPRNGAELAVPFRITCFSITNVNDDWVRVENKPENCPVPGISDYPYAGFLRWKKDGKVLINFGL